MRRIGIRQFSRSMYSEIKDLPVIVTKDGKDAFIVTPTIKYKAVLPDETVWIHTELSKKRGELRVEDYI